VKLEKKGRTEGREFQYFCSFMRFAIEEEKTLNPKNLEGGCAKVNKPFRSEEKRNFRGFFWDFIFFPCSARSRSGNATQLTALFGRKDYVESAYWSKSECRCVTRIRGFHASRLLRRICSRNTACGQAVDL
jgi:hypothetical protein